VHERGAPHLIDPSKLLASAKQLYGDDMDRLWGEVAPVPEENIVALSGGETVEGFRVEYTPGHASHHVCYLHEDTGDAYVGDVAGVRIPPAGPTIAPTPPPDIDLEAWDRSLDAVAGWRPASLRLTHFGERPTEEAVEEAREALARAAERSRGADRDSFTRAYEAELAESDDETALRTRQSSPVDHQWLGLERYWAKRTDRAQAG
jgi:glyoxylase-like metal-dependent hydrolase (beta-lactamase superfamily II)